MKHILILSAMLLGFVSNAAAQKTVILDAMKDELTRSMKELKMDGEAGPYYVSYLIADSYSADVNADQGAITLSAEGRARTLRVDLRVGDYESDNSNFVSLASLTSSGASMQLPIDDDYDTLRRRIWQATDRTYKGAVETLTAKKTAARNTVQTETLPDFTRGEAVRSLAGENAFDFPRKQWEDRVTRIAGQFQRQSLIRNSRVNLVIRITNMYYVNSEGTEAIEPSSSARMIIAATTHAEDGMPLSGYRDYVATQATDLPELAKLENDVSELIAELTDVRNAPLADEYNGPVLFEGETAGLLFQRGLSGLLAASRSPMTDSALRMQMAPENPFLNRLNMKVAASFLSIRDVPTLKTFDGKPLPGAYAIDEEGVPAREVNLIEDGILKNFLSSRIPAKGAGQSNGHARGGANPGVIRITSSNRKPDAELKRELIDAVREEGLPFGYIVRGLTDITLADDATAVVTVLNLLSSPATQGPNQFRLPVPSMIYRIYPDGREERVRGIEFDLINVSAFRNILATSEGDTVYNYQLSPLSGSGGILSLLTGTSIRENYATVITPSLLVNGIDLKKSTGNYPKPPVVAYPPER
jgi:predicted Zn-dependent protease